ncbi:nitrate reductase [Rhodoferax sp.]|uniref:periplasmic nitrate reductase, NapE protein n=1 Tax=Rhodoferax sp. TaxID=50421 RepID=UPI0025D278BB|nr:nitrate reductase [Rhodoferax sp.]MCM2295050.1 periplasmic nitrate reductase, NapE protein [Rhodoferax sp.]
MNNKPDDFSGTTASTLASQSEWRKFLLLACVGLPATMGALMVVYGFLVWFSQLLFFGPPA